MMQEVMNINPDVTDVNLEKIETGAVLLSQERTTTSPIPEFVLMVDTSPSVSRNRRVL